MARVIARTKVKRDNSKFIYYIKDGAVMQAPRRNSKGRGKKKIVAKWGTKRDMDYSKNIYFLDRQGNVAAATRRNSSGKRRKKTKK